MRPGINLLRVTAWLSLVATCACNSLPDGGNPKVMPARHTFSYLALGEPHTIGEGVPAEQRWPAQLAELLGGEGYPVGKMYAEWAGLALPAALQALRSGK